MWRRKGPPKVGRLQGSLSEQFRLPRSRFRSSNLRPNNDRDDRTSPVNLCVLCRRSSTESKNAVPAFAAASAAGNRASVTIVTASGFSRHLQLLAVLSAASFQPNECCLRGRHIFRYLLYMGPEGSSANGTLRDIVRPSASRLSSSWKISSSCFRGDARSLPSPHHRRFGHDHRAGYPAC